MTKIDHTRALKIALCAILYLLAFGIMIASQNGALEGYGDGTVLAAVLTAAVTIVVITFLWIKALGIVGPQEEPVSQSTQKSRNVLLFAAIIGGVIGFGFALSGDLRDGGAALFSNNPIAPIAAIAFGALFVLASIWSSIRWHRAADEHERAAANSGAYAGMLAYVVLTPLWWLGARASLVPPQDPMIVFAIVLAVYAAVWTYQRGD
ncbi:hypothetical protein [Pontixanthobacter aquaemixtae]|uniref:Uncharacterized protein n=1 Tax=Pontixanthobacter aquaemixtae TaxID=1958940 RepID=A0A844ZSB5_9SPHN|nr:hypothetical protein [Pontixanthobacter aquaemixtae]MXO90202.1 hypothetical protein [Pontixanthobacter aquaemixtae]